jgi:hypothetical protein
VVIVGDFSKSLELNGEFVYVVGRFGDQGSPLMGGGMIKVGFDPAGVLGRLGGTKVD